MRRNGLKTMGGDVMRWQAYRSAGAGGKLSMLAGALPGAGASAARGAWGRMSMAGLRGSEAYMMGTGLQRGGMLARGAAGGLAGAARGAAGALGLGSLGTALMGLLRVAGPVGLAIGGVLAVMDVLKDDTNEVGNFFWDLVGKLRESLDSLASSFGFGEGSGGFMGMLGKMGTFIGETLTLALSTGVMAITLFVDGINLMVDVVRAAGATFGEMYMQYDRAGGGLAGFRAIDVSAAASAGWEYAKGQRRKDDAVAEAMREKRKREEDQKDANDDVANNGDKKPPVQVKVELHQTNVTDASPDRIAFKTMELLEDAFTNRRLSSSPMLGGG